MGRNSTTSSLAPGFRFHPTDEELVLFYLKRKLVRKDFNFDAISDVDVYKEEPWDLPSKSKLKSRDLEWYFFCVLDKKYGNKLRTNRATGKGYWKTTGKDRAVYQGSRVVGMKKTLVYHNGRAPKGARTNWVMHEFRFTDEKFEKSGITLDAFVLCRIFQKSGPGPKNGEKYGAPFIEEEWEDDDEETHYPGEEAPVANDLTFGDHNFLDLDELDQILNANIASRNAPLPSTFSYGESSKSAEAPNDILKDDQEPMKDHFEAADGLHLGGSNKLDDIQGHPVDLVPYEPVVDSFNDDYLVDELYFDATQNLTFGEGNFLETCDLPKSNEANASGLGMLEEYLSFSNIDDESIQIMGLDSSQPIGSENLVAEPSPLSPMPLNESSMPNGHILKAYKGDGLSSSEQILEAENINSVTNDDFIKKASYMLGNISAPSAFAAEFPSKEAMLLLNSATRASNLVHIRAEIISITNCGKSGSQTDCLAAKNGDVDFVTSHGLSRGFGSASLVPLYNIVSEKSGLSMPRAIWYFFFTCVLIISISFKVGTFIYAR